MQSPLLSDMRSKSAMIGSIVHSVSFGNVEIINNGMIIYSNNGIIDQLLDLDKTPFDSKKLSEFRSVTDCTGKLILPGFVDAHCHAPQYVFSGTGMDLPLLAWLEKYTFPCEAKFADDTFARNSYEKSIRRHLKSGTTFAAYFATIHNSGGKVLVDVINRVGQRAFVGKVSMDRNSPDFYIEETARGCEDAEEFARYVLSMTQVGAAFLRSVDLQSTLTAAELLEHSRNMRQAGRLSLERATSGSSSPRTSLLPSGNKRPRSVSTDDSDMMGGSLLRGNINTNSAASGAAPVSGDRGRRLSSDGPPVAETFTAARARAISASDMDLYGGFEDDAFYESGQFNVADYEFPPAAGTASAVSAVGSSGSSSGSSSESITTLLNHPFTPLVLPCVTPRFVPTCTAEMMGRLGQIAAKYGLPVQSHLSESPGEIDWVKELHPECANYGSVYHKFGLLNAHTIMAHCCHSDATERQLLADTDTAVVHCASSNFNLDSGVLDVHGCLSQGIRVGLGTDVAGGYSASMLDALRQTIIASKCILFESRGDLQVAAPTIALMADHTAASGKDKAGAADGSTSTSSEAGNDSDELAVDPTTTTTTTTATVVTTETAAATSTAAAATTATTVKPKPKYKPLSYKEAYHLATVGGAEALGMGKVVGNFLPGKKLDCLIVDPAVVNGPFDLFEGEGVSEFFQKFLFLGDDRNIVSVFVDGRQVI